VPATRKLGKKIVGERGEQMGRQGLGRFPNVQPLKIASREKRAARSLRETMQYLPGLTVQCINPFCEARGHWLRADATTPLGIEGRCPCCGDFLRNVPPPLGRLRIRPRSLTARPLRPRPR